MRHVVYMAAYWTAVVIAIRLAVCFPKSLLARVLFLPLGPMPIRGESRSDFFLRWVRAAIEWSAQAGVLFAIGWLATRWHASLLDSPSFVVLWAVVIPSVGAASAIVAVVAMIRSQLAARVNGRRPVTLGR